MSPGTLVEMHDTGEMGIVVQTWMNGGVTDCYVAFFTPPDGDNAPERPVILRYYAVSLRALTKTGIGEAQYLDAVCQAQSWKARALRAEAALRAGVARAGGG